MQSEITKMSAAVFVPAIDDEKDSRLLQIIAAMLESYEAVFILSSTTTILHLKYVFYKIVQLKNWVESIMQSQITRAAMSPAAAVDISEYRTYVQIDSTQYPAEEFLKTLIKGYNIVLTRIKMMLAAERAAALAAKSTAALAAARAAALAAAREATTAARAATLYSDNIAEMANKIREQLWKLAADFGFAIPDGFLSHLECACRMCPIAIPNDLFASLMGMVCAIIICGSFNNNYSSKISLRKCVPNFDEMLKSCGLYYPSKVNEFQNMIRNLHKILKVIAGFGSRSAKSTPFYAYRKDTPEWQANQAAAAHAEVTTTNPQ